MPLIPAHRRQKQVNLCEFEASLVYRVSVRTGFKATQRNLVSKYSKNKTNKQENKTKQRILTMAPEGAFTYFHARKHVSVTSELL